MTRTFTGTFSLRPRGGLIGTSWQENPEIIARHDGVFLRFAAPTGKEAMVSAAEIEKACAPAGAQVVREWAAMVVSQCRPVTNDKGQFVYPMDEE